MVSFVAESKSNDLLNELTTFIFSDESMNDIDFAKYKREASNLPTPEEEALIDVLTHCAARRYEQAKEKALVAIRQYSGDSFVTSNIIWAMVYIGKPTVAYKAIKLMPLESADKLDVENIITTNYLFNDFGLDAQLNEWLFRTQQTEILEWKLENSEVRRNLMRDIETKFEVSSSTVTELSVVAAQVVEKHEGVILNNTILSIPPESDKAALTVYVECTPEKLFELNWDLSGELVDAELDDVRCVVHFELLGSNLVPFSERLQSAS